MEPLSLSLDKLQERLGELLVALLLNAQTGSNKFDPRPLVSEFGQLIAAMQQIENDTTAQAGAPADSASNLGKTAYQLLERSAQQLAQSDIDSGKSILELHTDFANWVSCQGGTPSQNMFALSHHAPIQSISACNRVEQPNQAPHRRTLH